MERGLKDYALLMLKGVGMGAADVVPGVSGGTIAFIVGIYDELIDSIKSINGKSLKLFFTGKWGAFWKAINGNFLISIVAGIAVSVFSLAKVITCILPSQSGAYHLSLPMYRALPMQPKCNEGSAPLKPSLQNPIGYSCNPGGHSSR